MDFVLSKNRTSLVEILLHSCIVKTEIASTESWFLLMAFYKSNSMYMDFNMMLSYDHIPSYQKNLHKFHNSKGYQGTIHTFEALKVFYLWPKLHQDIMKYINKCDVCAKNLLNMAKYPKKLRNFISPSSSTGSGHHKSTASYIQRRLIGFNSNIYVHVSYKCFSWHFSWHLSVCHTYERKVTRKCHSSLPVRYIHS